MKRAFSIILLSVLVYFVSCQDSTTNGQVKENLSVELFEKKIAETPDVQLIDVRTSEEYADGHLRGARNMNVNREDYKEQFNMLDKKRPVYVYCLSGGRSGNAAKIMQKMGFKEVYNMEGGIMKWEAAGKHIETGSAPSPRAGMTVAEFNKQLSQKKYVLIDYNAKWCAPCKKMLPMLEAVVARKKDKLAFVRIDADEHKALMKEKGISGVPYLELYEDGKLVWKHDGAIEEKQLLDETRL
ncbi:MAG: gloB [Flavipsychrobacter sp.]|jgi:rhodanese-related sulfurtransferase/glutaredoxin|nr:gloB [Flavipsychrobacter sp.]